jgi:hypothetical protein
VNFTIKDVDLTRKHGNIVGYTWIYNMNQDNMQVPANVFSKKPFGSMRRTNLDHVYTSEHRCVEVFDVTLELYCYNL